MKRLGIVGGGQLGRMLALAAAPLGIRCVVLDPDPGCSAGQVCDQVVGRWDDAGALEELAGRCDVATYEFESLPADALDRLAAAVPLRPGTRSLRVAQDRLEEKTWFGRLGIPTADWRPLATAAELDHARAALADGPLVVKTRTDGYDGKGQVVASGADELDAAWQRLDRRPCIVERRVAFRRELSVVAARSGDGRVVVFRSVENTHRDGILRTTVAPAPDLSDDLHAEASDIVSRLAAELGHVGVITLELFDTPGGLVANEFAPRVHNSGHWSIEGASVSQFELHVRAVCDLPLVQPAARAPRTVMVNLLGDVPPAELLLGEHEVHLHAYGKQPRAGRKVGHVTLLDPAGEARARVEQLAGHAAGDVVPA